MQKLIETGSSIGAGSLITNEEFGLDNDYYQYNLDDLIEAGREKIRFTPPSNPVEDYLHSTEVLP